MAKLLYLTHRLPFPPDKGDKIITHHFLRHLAAHHEVHLGCFVDDPADLEHLPEVRRHCARLHAVPIEPRRRKWLAARALLSRRSITEVFHHHAGLAAWAQHTAAQPGMQAVLAFCSAMAPLAASPAFAQLRRVTHFADVDSQKWVAYAEEQRGPMRHVYAREGRRLLALERAMSERYDITSFVSENDAALYRRLAPESAHKVRVIPNGVDVDYFDPALALPSPFVGDEGASAASAEPPIVFTGAMDYWPNADAVRWFATEVLPAVRAVRPRAGFCIVGSKPTAEVQALAALPGVTVTGRVPDVRPYLLHAGAVVAPLRVARGVQNKALEALAMGREVLLTPETAAGLLPDDVVAANTCADAPALATAVLQRLSQPRHSAAARAYVLKRYAWAASFAALDEALGL
jgi:polysaccharide biosynthesis protein PslH